MIILELFITSLILFFLIAPKAPFTELSLSKKKTLAPKHENIWKGFFQLYQIL